MMIYTTKHEGQVASRRSEGHQVPLYKFAIWTCNPEGKWVCQSYTSRRDLAEKRLAEYSSWKRAAIAPVEHEFKPVKHKGPVDFPGDKFERCGVRFEKDSDGLYSGRRGQYKGYEIALRCTGKVFSAVVYPASQPENWNARHYVNNGGLDSRVQKAKEIVDSLPPLHS